MDYGQSIAYLHALNMMGGRLGLSRVKALLLRLGNPQSKFKVILVGGTNGKGSTAAMLASILQAAGFRVGRFTKPHLSRFTERICLDGKEISEKGLARIVSRVRGECAEMKGEKPTFFEVTVASALAYFAGKKADFAVLEVGLGGRLDATNACGALVSVITNVSLEHADILGNTVRKIAHEKAGIIKKDGILITAAGKEALPVLRGICKKRKARVFSLGREMKSSMVSSGLEGQEFSFSGFGKSYPRLRIPLLGAHQLDNAACAIGAAEALESLGFEIGERAVREGLGNVRWPGRMEVVQREPLVILDCAKDEEAMKRLALEIRRIGRNRTVLVLSISSDKDVEGMVRAIVPEADIVIAAEHTTRGRAVPAGKLAGLAAKSSGKGAKILVVGKVRNAAAKAVSLAGKGGLVLITGSVFTVGEAREKWFPGRRPEHSLNEIPKG